MLNLMLSAYIAHARHFLNVNRTEEDRKQIELAESRMNTKVTINGKEYLLRELIQP